MPVATAKPPGATAIRPFTVEIPEVELEALRARLRVTRWPTKELVEDRSQACSWRTAR